MKRTELVIRVVIVVLAVFSAVAIVLQIVNEKTSPIETAYEIITFAVAAIALVLAITQGIYNTRTSNELKEIIHDMHKVMKAEKDNLRYDAELVKEVEEDLELNRKVAKSLSKK